jgi:hypothetical protein
MKENFDKAFDLLIELEGRDGINSFYGIDKYAFPEEYAEIQQLPEDKQLDYAKTFYKKNFWDKLDCDNLADKVDIAAFQFAVNIYWKRVLALLKMMEGKYDNPAIMWRDVLFHQIEFYYLIGKGDDAKYLRGWIGRVIRTWKSLQEQK